MKDLEQIVNEGYYVAPSFPDDFWNMPLEEKTVPLVMFPQGFCCRKIVCMGGWGLRMALTPSGNFCLPDKLGWLSGHQTWCLALGM